MANNFIMGGKLGDFLHSMFAVKHLSEANNTKANIFMYDIGWERGIENTFAELTPILLQQTYIESVSILTEYELDPIQTPETNSPTRVFDKQLLSEGYIDLGNYIRSPLLYKACWSDIYADTFKFSITTPHKWINYNKTNPKFENKVVIHRRYNPIRLNNEFPYAEIIEQYKDQVVFVAMTEDDYNQFPYNDVVPFEKATTLDDLFTIVNSCDMVISNLTALAVVAHSMDKLRIIELPSTPDAIHCIGEERYSKNVFWYLNKNTHNLI